MSPSKSTASRTLVRNARELEALAARSKKTRQNALMVLARSRRDRSTIAQAIRVSA